MDVHEILREHNSFMRMLSAFDEHYTYKSEVESRPEILDEESLDGILNKIETPENPMGDFGDPQFLRIRFLSADSVQVRCPQDDRIFRRDYVTERRRIFADWDLEDPEKLPDVYRALLDRNQVMRSGSMEMTQDGRFVSLNFGIRRPQKADEKLIALGFLIYQKQAEWGWYVMSPSLHSECIEPNFRNDTETHPVLWAQKRAEMAMGAMAEALGGDCPGNDIVKVYENLAATVCNPTPPELQESVEYDLSSEDAQWLEKQKEWFAGSEKRFEAGTWCPELVYVLLEYRNILRQSSGKKEHPLNAFATSLPQSLENGLVIHRVCQLQKDLQTMYDLSVLDSLIRASELIVDIYAQGPKPWWFEENICLLAGLEERQQEIDPDTLGLLAGECGFAFRDALVPYLDFGHRLGAIDGLEFDDAITFFAEITKSFGIGNPKRIQHIVEHAEALVREVEPEQRTEILKKFLINDALSQAPRSALVGKMQGEMVGLEFPGTIGLLDKEYLHEQKIEDDDALRPEHLRLALSRLALPIEERNLRIPVKQKYLRRAQNNPAHGLLLGDSSGKREIYALGTTQGRPPEEKDSLALVREKPLSSLQTFYERLRTECNDDPSVARNYFAFCAGHMPEPLNPPPGFLKFLRQFMNIRDPEWRWEGLEHPYDREDRSQKNAESQVNRMLFITSMLELWKNGIFSWEMVWGYFEWIVADIPEEKKRVLEAQARKLNAPERRKKHQTVHLERKQVLPPELLRGYDRRDDTDRVIKSHKRKLSRLKRILGVRERTDKVYYCLEGRRHLKVFVPPYGARRWKKRKRKGTLPDTGKMQLDTEDWIVISQQRAKRALTRVRQSMASKENTRENHEWEEGQRKHCHPSTCYPPENDYYDYGGWAGFANESAKEENDWEGKIQMEMRVVHAMRLRALREIAGIEQPFPEEEIDYMDAHDALNHHLRECMENAVGDARTEQQNQRLGASMACLSQMEFLSNLVQQDIIPGPKAADLWREFLVLAIDEPATAQSFLHNTEFIPQLQNLESLMDVAGFIERLQRFSGVEFWAELQRYRQTIHILSDLWGDLERMQKQLNAGYFQQRNAVFNITPEIIREIWTQAEQNLSSVWEHNIEVMKTYLYPFDTIAQPIIQEWEERVQDWRDYVELRVEHDQYQEKQDRVRHSPLAGQNTCSRMTPYLLLKRIANPPERTDLLPDVKGGILPANTKHSSNQLTVSSSQFPKFSEVLSDIETRIIEERKKYFGLPPIGAKIHVLRLVSDEAYIFLRESLGLRSTAFRLRHAGAMLCLPAMPTSFELENLVRLLAIDGVVDDNEPELQLCMSGDFKNKEDIAILMSAMMLSTQKMFRFRQESFMPQSSGHYDQTSAMMAARAAGEPNEGLPFARTSYERIDKLGCGNFEDILRYHLLAGILETGPMSDLAEDFKQKYKKILEEYGLSSVLKARWVKKADQPASTEMLREHFEQAVRPCMNAWFDNAQAYTEGEGLICEVQELFDELDQKVRNRSTQLLRQTQYESERQALFNF